MKRSKTDILVIILAIALMAVGALALVGCETTPTAPTVVAPTPTPTPAPTPEPTPATPRDCEAAYLSIYLSDTDGEVAFPLAIVPWIHAAYANKDGNEIDRRACKGFIPGAINWQNPAGYGRTPAECEWMGQELAQDRLLKCYSGGSVLIRAAAHVDGREIGGSTVFRVVQ